MCSTHTMHVLFTAHSASPFPGAHLGQVRDAQDLRRSWDWWRGPARPQASQAGAQARANAGVQLVQHQQGRAGGHQRKWVSAWGD